MTDIGFAVYAACVDFLLQLARALGITYRDANALLFFVLWPITTVALAAFSMVETTRLRRAARRRT